MATSFRYEPNIAAREKHVMAAYRDRELETLARANEVLYEKMAPGTGIEFEMSLTELDAEIARRRARDVEDDEEADPAPWPKPVDGIKLLHELRSVFERHAFVEPRYLRAVALWTLFTHLHDASQISPILALTSPTKRSGKTTVLTLLHKLVPRPFAASNATAASIFRTITSYRPVLLIDEGDTFIHGKQELRGIINSGHNKSQAWVARADGTYSTWAAKAIGLIGELPDTLRDRAIAIELFRKPADAVVRPIPPRGNTYIGLHRRCRRWALDNFDKVRDHEPQRPAGVDDRAFDNWRALLAIAEVAGGKWPMRARKACTQISHRRESDDPLELLLQDMQMLFDRNGGRNLSSTEVRAALVKKEHRPWPDYHGPGKPISTRGIAILLKLVKIQPQQVPVRGHRPNGYRLEQFEKAFRIYAPRKKPE